MADQKKRISELPLVSSTDGLMTLGVNNQNESVKVPLGDLLTALRAAIDDVVPVMRIEDIDAVPASLADAIAMCKNARGMRRVVTAGYGGTRLNVGVIDMFSDNMGHQLTEVLTTHYMMNEQGVPDFNSHRDDEIYMYYRSYGVTIDTEAIPKGAWGAWNYAVLPASVTRTAISSLKDGVESLEAAMQDKQDAAHRDVLEFGGFVTALTPGGVEVHDQSASGDYTVKLVSGTGYFVAEIKGEYYSNWSESKSWGVPIAGRGIPGKKGKLYVDTAGNAIYRYDGAGPVKVSGEADLSALEMRLTQIEADLAKAATEPISDPEIDVLK